jgi:hypothetical protein
MQDITLTTPNPDHFVEGKNNQMMYVAENLGATKSEGSFQIFHIQG